MPTNREKVTRKLRAILSADVKGYSLLMADNEACTIKTLKEYEASLTMRRGTLTGTLPDDEIPSSDIG